MGAPRRNSIIPAAAFSVVAHAALFAFVILTWPKSPPLTMGAVPVTLISTQPEAASPAPPTPDPIPAPDPTPEPVETPPTPAPPQPAPPKPTPKPASPKPEPSKPVKPAPAPSKTPPPKSKPVPDDASFLTNIADAKPAHPAPARPHPAAGMGHAAVNMGPVLSALQSKLGRLWRPNCNAAAGGALKIAVRFVVGDDARVVAYSTQVQDPRTGGWVVFSDAKSSGLHEFSAAFNAIQQNDVWKDAARRAARAVKAGEPYSELPPEVFNQKIVVNFDSQRACQ